MADEDGTRARRAAEIADDGAGIAGGDGARQHRPDLIIESKGHAPGH